MVDPDSPKSFVELWGWCEQRARELAPLLPEGLLHDPARMLAYLKKQTEDFAKSDGDEGPARQFHTEFVGYLRNLGYDKSDRFGLEHLTTTRKPVTRPVPREAKRSGIQGEQGEIAPWAEFASLMGGLTVFDVLKDGDGKEFVNDSKPETVECVRLSDVKDRARSLCRRLMVSAGEIPARWDNDEIPQQPLRTIHDIAAWLEEKQKLLQQMAATVDGDEPLVDEVQLRRAVKAYEQSAAYQLNLREGKVVCPTDPAFAAFDAAIQPIASLPQSDSFWIGMLARQSGSSERILRAAIRGAELWLDAHPDLGASGRPDTLIRLETSDAERLQLQFRKLRDHIARLCDLSRKREARDALAGQGPRAAVQPPVASMGGKSSPANSAPISINEPSREAFAAYRVHKLLGKKQTETAEILTREFGFPVSQGQVSRWCTSVAKFVKAGGLLPEAFTKRERVESVDPADIEMGRRMDGRTPRQRERRSDE